MRWELDGPYLIVMPDSPYLHTYRIDYVNMEASRAGRSASPRKSGGRGTAGGGGAAGGRAAATPSAPRSAIFRQQVLGHYLEKNIKGILHETDKVLPTGAPRPQPRAVPPGHRGQPLPRRRPRPNISFRRGGGG